MIFKIKVVKAITNINMPMTTNAVLFVIHFHSFLMNSNIAVSTIYAKK